MKHLNRLWVVEADNALPPLLSGYESLLSSASAAPVEVRTVEAVAKAGVGVSPELVLFHSNLTAVEQLRQFISLHSFLPYSSVVIVSEERDEELHLLALEAGADDSIVTNDLTPAYLRKTVLLSLRRYRTEKTLKHGQEQLMACIQNTPNVAVQWYNANAEVLFWNRASESLFGWPPEEAIGKTVDELIVMPENKNFWLDKIRQMAAGEDSGLTKEWRFSHRTGREGYCLSTLFAIPSFTGEPWFVCMDVDVTALKQTENRLRQSEERYRSLIEQQGDALLIFDKEGSIRDVNSSATHLLQYGRDELRHLCLADVLWDGEAADPANIPALRTGDGGIWQRRMRRKDGTPVETEMHGKRLFDGLFVASIRDLTERLDAQQQLKKEKELSDSIINSLPGLFYLFTQEGRYLRWNRQQEAISGYSAEEIRRMNPLDFIPAEDRPAVQAAIDTTFACGQSAVEAHLLTKQGRRIPFYFTGIAVNYAGTGCLLGTGIDLSAMKNLERELLEQKTTAQKKVMQAMIEAEEKERNKLGLELHDNVNQILSVVRMYLSLLNAGEKMEEVSLPKAMDLLNEAIAEIRRLSHSLAISYKFETGLAGTLEEMVDNVKAAGGFAVNLQLPPGLDKYINRQQKLAVYRIVQEALNNVIKYAGATEVDIRMVLSPERLAMEIADNGQGFRPSKTAKGLGLNNITNRAEALDGKVEIEAAPGKGCRVKVEIPLREGRGEG